MAKTVQISGRELDASTEFATDLLIDGNAAAGSVDRVEVHLRSAEPDITLAGWQFQDWDTVDSELVVVYATAADNSITGTSQRDYLYGGGGEDRLYGLDGDDRTYGGSGAESHYGGTGNDRLSGGLGDDRLTGGTGDDSLYGSADNDRLFGNAGNDILDGGTGDDVLYGGGNNDLFYGGIGNDLLLRGSGNDTVYGGLDDDTVTWVSLNQFTSLHDGNDGIDTIDGGGGTFSGATFDLLFGVYTTALGAASWLNFENYGNDGSGDESVLGTLGNNVLTTGSGDNYIAGRAGDDQIFAGAGNDLIFGGDGTDLIDAGTGDDLIRVLNGELFDVVYGGGGTDTLDHSESSFSGTTFDFDRGEIRGPGVIAPLVIVDGIEVYQDGSGGNTIRSKGSGIYHGNGGDDTMAIADSGGGTLYGGAGLDRLDLSARSGGAVFALSTGLIDGASGLFTGFEAVTGGAGNDTLRGFDVTLLSETIEGGGGDDVIIKQSGTSTTPRDAYDGCTGINTFVLEWANPTFTGWAINLRTGLLTANGDTRATLANFRDVVVDGNGAAVVGDDGDNIITAIGTEAQTLSGLGGDDTIDGGGGIDRVVGGDGDDHVSGGADDDTVLGGIGNDVIHGNDGDDRLVGSSDDDMLYGGIGNDDLILGTEDDTGYGGADDDFLDGGTGIDSLFGGSGDDILIGGLGEDALYGNSDNDILQGGADNDLLAGGLGDDTLSGEVGDDLLNGGAGNDRLLGNGGADTFRFGGNWDDDVIVDFEVGVDRVQVVGLTAADVTLSPLGGGLHTLATFTSGDTIDFRNVTVAQLSGFADWDFV